MSAGIPTIALQAYGDATLQIEHEQPGCHLGWTSIAAIGYVETAHGTHGGAQLLADGRTSERILGPALNGTNGTAKVPATAETTKWHGDPKWDHAVGPMQFIPSSWHTWGADGDGDGIADPNDIDDAALTTARYLCASGADLRTPGGWSRAIFSYNHSDDYVRSILTTANAYAEGHRLSQCSNVPWMIARPSVLNARLKPTTAGETSPSTPSVSSPTACTTK